MENPGILICNGPSLADTPIRWLNRNTTLASNSFYAKSSLRPNHWFLEGQGHLKLTEERVARAKHMHIPDLVYVNSKYAQAEEFLPFQKKVIAITYWREDGTKIQGFQGAPRRAGHGTANSVTYAMFQYAFEMGFDPLLVVGMDMKFSDGGNWHFYDKEEVPEFHEMEYERFLRWRGRAEQSYKECAEYFADHGRILLNLTPDTACKALETDSMENWL